MKKWTCSSSVPGGLHSFRRISVSRHDPGYAAEHRFSWIDASRKLPEPIHSDSRIMSELRRKKNLKESDLYKNRGSCRKSFRICSGRENEMYVVAKVCQSRLGQPSLDVPQR